MDIENFMIGDWVCLYDSHGKLIGNEKLTKPSFLNALNSNSTIRLEPIRLTREMFQLNEWKIDGPYMNYKIDGFSTLTYYLHEHRLSCTWKGTDEYNNHAVVTDENMKIGCLIYVHEFQQALRLRNLNKMADNFKIDNEHV